MNGLWDENGEMIGTIMDETLRLIVFPRGMVGFSGVVNILIKRVERFVSDNCTLLQLILNGLMIKRVDLEITLIFQITTSYRWLL